MFKNHELLHSFYTQSSRVSSLRQRVRTKRRPALQLSTCDKLGFWPLSRDSPSRVGLFSVQGLPAAQLRCRGMYFRCLGRRKCKAGLFKDPDSIGMKIFSHSFKREICSEACTGKRDRGGCRVQITRSIMVD